MRRLRGIGGLSSPIGTAVIPVPFRDLKLVIDVRFQIIRDNVPSLLCMMDMIENQLDISILDPQVRYKNRSQDLVMESYFLVHRWNRSEMAYSLYTETELRKLHRTFGHPSVSALINILRRARPNEMTTDVKKVIEEISKNVCTVLNVW